MFWKYMWVQHQSYVILYRVIVHLLSPVLVCIIRIGEEDQIKYNSVATISHSVCGV